VLKRFNLLGGRKMNKILLILVFLFSSFTTVFSQTLSPILIDPPTEKDMVELNVTLDWSDFPGAINYVIELSADPDFNVLLSNTFPHPTVSNFTIPNGVLSSFTKYYWRVCAITSSGPTEFSPAFNFRTVGTPIQEIGSLEYVVIGLVIKNVINFAQGAILITRLETAKLQVILGHKQQAIFQLNKFIARVEILRNSNMLVDFWGNTLIIHANAIIVLIQGDEAGKIVVQNEPSKFSLEQNYPNPFNPSTTIEYTIPENGNVSVKVFDVSGREIETLIDKYQIAGSYIVVWNASNYSSGIYFCKLISGDKTDVKRMVLVK
jgi:hypothetical protein